MHAMTRTACGCLLLTGLVGVAGCEKERAGPLDLVAEQGQDEVRAVVGGEGGRLRFPGGAQLEIPPRLLQEEVTVTLKREDPSFDLSGKDFVGKAYRISPRLDFAPGAAKLFVPIDKTLPGLAEEINLRVYCYDRLETHGPEGAMVRNKWQVHRKTQFSGYSQDGKYLVFNLYETISDRTTKPPFGLFQAAFDMP